MKQHRFAIPVAVAALAAAWPTAPAMACSNLPTICEQQDQQFQAEQTRLAAEANAAAIEDYNARHPRVDPTQVRLDALSSMDDAFHAMGEAAPLLAKEVVKSHKEIERIRRGSWDFYQDTPSPAPGEFCAALFVNPEGVVRLSGPGGDYRGALLTFWGPGLPKPGKVRMIPVALAQSDDTGPAQSVRAFSYRQPGKLGWGAISFAVPSADALLRNMSDGLGFILTVDKRRVMAITWSGGTAAKERLGRCIAAGKG